MVNILASTPKGENDLFTVMHEAVTVCCCLLFAVIKIFIVHHVINSLCSCLAGFLTDNLVLLHQLSTISALSKASTSLSLVWHICSQPFTATFLAVLACLLVLISPLVNTPISTVSTPDTHTYIYIYMYIYVCVCVYVNHFNWSCT